jgi:hypothetical protein
MIITTEDGGAQLSLEGSTIQLRLSEKALAVADEKLEKKTGTGLGGVIASAVKTGVRAALNQVVEYDVSDIEDVDYTRGRLVFRYADGRRQPRSLDTFKLNGKSVLSSFSETDARAFIEEFRRVKSRV